MSLKIQEGTDFRYKNPISGLPCTDALCNTSMSGDFERLHTWFDLDKGNFYFHQSAWPCP